MTILALILIYLLAGFFLHFITIMGQEGAVIAFGPNGWFGELMSVLLWLPIVLYGFFRAILGMPQL